MKLKTAKFCPDCDEIFEGLAGAVCPSCLNRVIYFLADLWCGKRLRKKYLKGENNYSTTDYFSIVCRHLTVETTFIICRYYYQFNNSHNLLIIRYYLLMHL